MNNFIIIVLDGVGVGELPDANRYGDEGSATLQNIAKTVGNFNLENLQALGLGNMVNVETIRRSEKPLASFGKLAELSSGKDSTTGHWELGGFKVEKDFPYYPNGFPREIIEEFKAKTKLNGVLGNIPASGTEIIDELGDEHVKTGFPIVYTSADSVFQIAAHEEIIPLDRLYEICKITRNEILVGEHAVGRVIARPFIGNSGEYQRTVNRKDFSLDPFDTTILDVLASNGIRTIAIGKINDLFNHRGITDQIKTKSNAEGVKKIIEYALSARNSLIFANLVDFDVYYGHRNDPIGFYKALKEFDEKLPKILEAIDETDALVITADHGNDPTTVSTDHSREYAPLLYYRRNSVGKNLGTRETFSDVAKTAAEFFGVDNNLQGKSFLNE